MRPLARNGYTSAQVETALRSGHANYGARFELLNQNFTVVGNLDPPNPGVAATGYAPGTVTAATIEYDTTRKLMGSLDLTMLPDERLRTNPFQYRIKPYFQVGPMWDGGYAEWSMGVYPWSVPERNIVTGLEEWTITLADGFYDCDTSGPGPTGFQVWSSEPQSDALGRLFNLAGFTNLSGIQNTGAYFQYPRSWGLTRPLQGWGFMYMPSWDQGWGFYQDSSDPAVISVGGQSPNQTRSTTLLDIIQEINQGIGSVSWMDGDGRPIVIPAPDWTTLAPQVVFGSGADSINISPVNEATDMTQFCNRVFVWQEGGDSAIFYVALDANNVVPGHPLAQGQIKRYADKFISNSTADSQVAAEQAARKALLDGLSWHQTVEFDTLAWPSIEPYDILGLYIAGDAEFGTTVQNFQSQKCTLDMFTGEMHHTATRVYPVTKVGP